jgi:hypothetical protein
MSDFLNWPIPAETSCESFWTSDMTSKNDVLTSILMFFCQKSGREDTLPIPPLPLSFTVNTDHLMAGEVPPGCGPQSGVAPVNIPISFRSRAAYIAGVAGSQSGPLSLSFLLYSWRPTVLGRFPKPECSMTHYANTGRGEFTPRESEVKTERTPVLNILVPDYGKPGSWCRLSRAHN